MVAIEAESEVLAEKREAAAGAARGSPADLKALFCRLPFEEALEEEAAYNLVLRRSHGGGELCVVGGEVWRGGAIFLMCFGFNFISPKRIQIKKVFSFGFGVSEFFLLFWVWVRGLRLRLRLRLLDLAAVCADLGGAPAHLCEVLLGSDREGEVRVAARAVDENGLGSRILLLLAAVVAADGHLVAHLGEALLGCAREVEGDLAVAAGDRESG